MRSADKERIKTILASYTKAVMRLEQGLKEDPHDHDIVIDGVIQRFEFCFELAWKADSSWGEKKEGEYTF